MDVGIPGIARLTVERAAASAASRERAEPELLPFPERFVGTFEEDGRVRLATERLAFEVREVTTQDELFKVVGVRYEAYSRHLPELGRRLTAPEPADTQPGHTVLLAENRLDGTALATMRIQTNDLAPLALERSVGLPPWLKGSRLAEATRLAIADRVRGRYVSFVMFKAFWQFCLERSVEWMVVCARPPLDRIYLSLLFEDVVPGGALVPLRHAADVPHRALAFNVRTSEARWRTAGHPMYPFMALTLHPDIRIGVPGPTVLPIPGNCRDHAAAL